MANESVRTYSPAKKFAEDILHPLIEGHKNAKITTKLGALSMEEALKLSPSMRVVRRINALRDRISKLDGLVSEITATVRINGNKEQISLIQHIEKTLKQLDYDCENNWKEFIVTKGNGKKDLTPLFANVNEHLDHIYINIQRLMTLNRMLFFGSDNDFESHLEIKKRLVEENRQG